MSADIKVLKNAHWALDFYKKHGYGPMDEEMMKKLDIKEKTWEKILYRT